MAKPFVPGPLNERVSYKAARVANTEDLANCLRELNEDMAAIFEAYDMPSGLFKNMKTAGNIKAFLLGLQERYEELARG